MDEYINGHQMDGWNDRHECRTMDRIMNSEMGGHIDG